MRNAHLLCLTRYELRKNQTHVRIRVEYMENKIRYLFGTLSSPADPEHSAAWLELIKLNVWVVRIDFPQKRVENETSGAQSSSTMPCFSTFCSCSQVFPSDSTICGAVCSFCS